MVSGYTVYDTPPLIIIIIMVFRTAAFDKTAQTDKPLSTEELEIIRRLYANEVPDAQYDPYEPMTEWFTGKGKEEVMPLSAAPEPKRRWVPSKWEKQKVDRSRYSFSYVIDFRSSLSGHENCPRHPSRPDPSFQTKNDVPAPVLSNLVRTFYIPSPTTSRSQTSPSNQF
jgi:BOP1NT (NUC169) domain